MPITVLGVPCGQENNCFNNVRIGANLANPRVLIAKSWAVSGSREKIPLRMKEYILVYLSG